MSAIKTELAAFIAAHTSEDFIMTPITMREASLHTAWEQELPKVPMASVVDTVLDGCEVYDVPVRIYIPDTSRPLPVLIYYHGGGFAIDTVAVYDPVCRRIAQATQHIVISPEYRLAPENPYPAAYEDALAVARKALPALDALQIPYQADLTLCGDSAGGCMAAYTSPSADSSDPGLSLPGYDPLLPVGPGELQYPDGLYAGQDDLVFQPVFPSR